MAEFLQCNRLSELWKTIGQLHLSYLQTDESLDKLEQRDKLEGYIKEYLCLVPHDNKFSFHETADVLHKSASMKKDFSGYRAASAWNAIGMYAANLLTQPWRKEYRELKLFNGFYKHEIEANLVGADLMLQAMGYKYIGHTTMVLDGPIDPDRVSNVSRDSLMAFVECQLLKTIWEEVSRRFNCTWLEVLEFRENHIGTPESAAKGLVYQFHQRHYQEQHQHQRPLAYHATAPMDAYGTASRFHQPAASCMYGQLQPFHPVPHMGYYNYAPYAAQPHGYTLPTQQRFSGIITPQQAIPPTMAYPIPAPIHPSYHHPVLKSQDLYPTNGHHPHHNYASQMSVPLQNGYNVTPSSITCTTVPVQNYTCPVPTAQLIELDVSAPPQAAASETQQTYLPTETPSTVLMPRTVLNQDQPGSTLRRTSERPPHDPPSHSYSTNLPLTSGKAKEDGTGTFESWDYVFRNLESQGYSKDLGERPDILSPSPERRGGSSSENNQEEARNNHSHAPVKGLEETLMELRLEEYHKKILPPEHQPLKINEALHKIRLESEKEPPRLLPIRNSSYDGVDGSVSVYDNMSSPPKEHPEREKPVTIVTNTSKSIANSRTTYTKPSSRTLPREDTRKYGDESDAFLSYGATTHFSSATLDPKVIQNKHDTPPEPNKPLLEEKKESNRDPKSQVSDKDKWECVTCTFLNLPSHEVCEMCGKSKTRGPEVKPLASGGQECPKCTLVNEKGVGTCEACGSSLKDSPTYI